MARIPSFHLRGGQLFYAKSGASVPANYASKLNVDLAKKGVYKDGKKVGTLRQKTLPKNASDTIDRNLKRRPRVPTTDMDAVRGGVQVGRPKGIGSGSDNIKIDREEQQIINFGKAVDELTRMGRLDPGDAEGMKVAYKLGSKITRTLLWDDVHGMFDEYGYQYETVGWDD